jgi:GNAT superfamily N-acetyltransferase
MIDSLLASTWQVVETLRERGGARALLKGVYWRGQLVPVERDLSTVPAVDGLLRKVNVELARITPGSWRENPATYSVASRRYKARKYLARGFGAYAVVRDGKVIGDIWHAPRGATKAELAHRDFDVLGIEPGRKDVYLFDMFIDPKHRGEALAVPLMGGALHALGQLGCEKAYGFFTADNIPALWVHRILKYKELARVTIRRVLGHTQVVPAKPKGARAELAIPAAG